MYSNGRWTEDDEYDVLKVIQVTRHHIYKDVKICECTKSSTNTFENNNVKILKFGKSHEKADLTKCVDYKDNII